MLLQIWYIFQFIASQKQIHKEYGTQAKSQQKRR